MSGKHWMGLYWKDMGNQVRMALPSVFGHNNLTSSELFARRGDIPNQTNDPWTTFEIALREPTPMPVAFDFTQFLVSSIAFMTRLREVSVYFDDKRLVHLTKGTGIPKQLTIPPGLTPTSPMGFMCVKNFTSACEGFIDNRILSVLTIVTRYSPAHYRRSHELGL